MDRSDLLTWVEIEEKAVRKNLETFSERIRPGCKKMAVVKANAYGHGIGEISRLALKSGAHCLGVYAPEEALLLRESGVGAPIVALGFAMPHLIRKLAKQQISFTVSSLEQLRTVAQEVSVPCRIHLKLDTGLRRLGMLAEDLEEASAILEKNPAIVLEGLFTHFANIEDTLNHDFARNQLLRFEEMCRPFLRYEPLRHCACSAAALLFRETNFEMVRIGVSLYGMWPSKETLITSLTEFGGEARLCPVMTWKTRIIQVKDVLPGDTVGYGRSHVVTRPGKIAVLPVGYADGYDRGFSNLSHVLIKGRKAPVVGRICMNMCMADVSHIENAAIGDETVLLGSQGDDAVSAEYLAQLIGTINYEITTRISASIPRIVL